MAAKEPVRRVRLQKLATAYVQFAVRQRARFDLMWRSTLLDPDDREFRETKDRAFRIIDASVTGVDRFVDGLLRQTVYLGLRSDKPATEVRREPAGS